MKITLQLFGAFRQFGDFLELNLPEKGRVSDVRSALGLKVEARDGLISSSRFATETEVLNEDALLQDGAVLAIIPPVSGG